VARRHRQQVCGALALLPERGALTGPASRQQQRAPGALAELRRKERTRTELAQHEPFGLVCGGRSSCGSGGSSVSGIAPQTPRRSTSPRRRDRSARARGPPRRGPTGRAPDRRTGRAGRPASRRVRPGSARSPPYGRRAAPSSRLSDPAGTGGDCPRPARRARAVERAGCGRLRAVTCRARGPARRWHARTRAGAQARRLSRTASCQARPAQERRGRGRG